MFPLPFHMGDYIAFDIESGTVSVNADSISDILKGRKENRKKLKWNPSYYSGFKISGVSARSYQVNAQEYWEFTFHNDSDEETISGCFFAIYHQGQAVKNIYYEKVKVDEKEEFRIHVLAPSFRLDEVLLHIDNIVHQDVAFNEQFDWIEKKTRDLEKLIDRLRTEDTIDIEPPKQESEKSIVIPVECTYDKKFYSRMYWLRKHQIIAELISGFGLQQYQIPISSSNEEMLLLIYGRHYMEPPLISPEEARGRSLKSSDEDIVKSSPVMQLVDEVYLKVADSGEGAVVRCSQAMRTFSGVVKRLYKWIDSNYNYAFKQYKQSSEDIVHWKNEYRLYQFIKMFYPDALFQYRTEWLEGQSFDIYIPMLDCAIEYQGQQHFEEVDYFGGEELFNDYARRDAEKREKCRENDVRLLEWTYTEKVYFDNVAKFVSEKVGEDSTSVTEVIEKLSDSVPMPVSNVLRLKKEHYHVSKQKAVENRITDFKLGQYSLLGVLLEQYTSYSEAESVTGISKGQIIKAAGGYRETAGNFQWRKSNECLEERIPPLQKKSQSGEAKAVIQISSDGEVLCEFPSVAEAVRTTGINSRSIRDVLTGRQKTAGSYYWIYKDSR